MNFSIITSMYYSEPFILEFYSRIKNVASKIGDDYEIIFVDDGSPDNSVRLVNQIRESDSKVKLLKLTRNFGHHQALIAGINKSIGDLVFLIDCDLEEKPEILGDIYEEYLKKPDIEMIYGVQKYRKGGILESLSGKVYYTLLNFISDQRIEPNQSTIRLFTRKFVSALQQYEEKAFTLGQLCNYVGFPKSSFFFVKENKGKTTYTFKKKVKLAIFSITADSTKPLILTSYFGMISSILGLIIGTFAILHKFIQGAAIGWTSIMASIWFLGGAIIFSISVVGLYLITTLKEVKNRPRYVVANYE